jgi:hypothetical protein
MGGGLICKTSIALFLNFVYVWKMIRLTSRVNSASWQN